MKFFECPKCKSRDVFVEGSGKQVALYCGECGNWIKWLNKKEIKIAQRQEEMMNGVDDMYTEDM